MDSTRICHFCRHCEASARKSWQSILTRLLRPIVLAIEGAGLSLRARQKLSVAIHF
ncbi:hypothetical protein HFN_2229 [Helicobacter fennelliae MRY12-0050]|uniref:Uncharacterized protein n=1 Tax=Helicobacter fennelliae MRY12-0050 TaxID=1325130 RepID=T1DVT2_9HELI|nr:hypothetical protein HFN_2229 [Helicobacter fennelliae MRY12-0050]